MMAITTRSSTNVKPCALRNDRPWRRIRTRWIGDCRHTESRRLCRRFLQGIAHLDRRDLSHPPPPMSVTGDNEPHWTMRSWKRLAVELVHYQGGLLGVIRIDFRNREEGRIAVVSLDDHVPAELVAARFGSENNLGQAQ